MNKSVVVALMSVAVTSLCAAQSSTGLDESKTQEAEAIPPAPQTYMGREIATTMHYAGAPWLTRESREREEGTKLLLEQLDIEPGITICDMGCGNGFYTIPMAEQTGETGRVYAVDIQQEMLDLLQIVAEEAKLSNIEGVLGSVIDPKLPEASIDLMLVVDVYHEMSHPEQMLAAIRKSLKPDGRLVLVEFRAEDPKVPIKKLHKMSKAQVLRELTTNGFKLTGEFNGLPRQHMLTFQIDPDWETESRAHEQIRALDLPSQVPIPASIDFRKRFTFRMCVNMRDVPDDLPTLAANKAWSEGEIRDYTTNNEYGFGRESGTERGFAISVLPDGAWTFNAGNGKSRIDHRPEGADQGIADGRWHEVGFAVDQERGVAHLFHDGRRVAIHDLRQVRDLRSDMTAIQLGAEGVDVEIAAVRLEPGVLSREMAAEQFAKRFGEARRPSAPPSWDGRPLRVLAWNIWHGGRRKGRDEGVERVVDVIKQCDADIVLMQETYGSGPRISGRLGFDYFLRSSNLSVMSRYPIVDVHRLGSGFRFGGVTIELKPGVQVQAYSLWIDYLPSVGKQLAEGATAEQLEAADARTRGSDMQRILEALLAHLEQTPDMPVIVGGDFNSGSHLDWTAAAAGQSNHMGRVVTWPVSKMMHDAGFVDAFRAAHPDSIKEPGLTWSPEFPDSHQDRIDYVYLRGRQWAVEEAAVLSEHPRGWPSDHAAAFAVLVLDDR